MNILENFRRIKAFVFDVDGVLTDHGVFVFASGKTVRKLNDKDLVALQKVIKSDLKIAIISRAGLGGLVEIFKKMGITDIFENTLDKKDAYLTFKYSYDLNDEHILYMGDDLPDYEAMRFAGLTACPTDASIEIKEISQYISRFKGGEGCVRDVIEKVLRLKKQWHSSANNAAEEKSKDNNRHKGKKNKNRNNHKNRNY